jgi:hypothetical protein
VAVGGAVAVGVTLDTCVQLGVAALAVGAATTGTRIDTLVVDALKAVGAAARAGLFEDTPAGWHTASARAVCVFDTLRPTHTEARFTHPTGAAVGVFLAGRGAKAAGPRFAGAVLGAVGVAGAHVGGHAALAGVAVADLLGKAIPVHEAGARRLEDAEFMGVFAGPGGAPTGAAGDEHHPDEATRRLAGQVALEARLGAAGEGTKTGRLSVSPVTTVKRACTWSAPRAMAVM